MQTSPISTLAPPPPPPAPPLNAVRGNDTRRDRRGFRSAMGTAAVAVAAGVSLIFFDRSPLGISPFLFLVVVPFERLFPRHRDQRFRRPALGTDVGYALAAPALQFLGLLVATPVAVASLVWIPGLLLRPVVAMIPAAPTPFAGIALFDLAIYWVHRWSHEVPFLWRFHAIHHSTENLDRISGFRNHPFDGAIVAPPFVFLLAAGFSAEFSGAPAIIQLVLGLFLHANVRWRLRPLQCIVITPEFRHWHHANEPEGVNTNYSVFLPLWDIVFGTYAMPRHKRPQRYGVDEYIPSGIAAQLRHPFRGTGNPFRHLRHPIRGLRLCVRQARILLHDIAGSTGRHRTVRRS